jgi:hydrogenase maturation protease
MTDKILIACIGNIFLGDDAFGVEMARRLVQSPLREGVNVVDFGIRSYDLAYALMRDWDLVILVDALPRGGSPGTLYVLEPELPSEGELSLDAHTMDAHTMNPVSVLKLVHALGGKAGRVLVVGCEPGSLAPNPYGSMGLSAVVEAALDDAVRMIHDLIARTRSPQVAA